MSNFKTAILTAIIALPLGFAAAGPMRGHPQLKLAMADLDKAWEHISASQKANEWGGDEGGHGARAKEAIQTAKDEVRQAAEFLDKK